MPALNDPRLQLYDIPKVPILTVGRLIKIVARYFPYLRPFWPEVLLLTLVLPLAGSVLLLVLPFCSRMFFDDVFPKGDKGLLLRLAFLGFGSVLVERTLMILIRVAVASHLRVRILGALGRDVYYKVLSFSMRYHQSTSVGEKIFRCDTDLIDTSEMLGVQIPGICLYITQFWVTIGAICLIDWRPLAITVLGSPLFLLIAQSVYNIYRRIDLWQRVQGQAATARLEETLSNVEIVYSHATREMEGSRYFQALAPYTLANMMYWFMTEVSIVLVWPTGLPAITSVVATGIVGSLLMVGGELTLGEYTALSGLIVQSLIPLGILISNYQSLRLRTVVAERVLSLLDSAEIVPETALPIEISNLKGEVEFRDVHFAYDPENPVLKGVSFRIDPGSRVAFVGRSGVGKSTILNLLLRFYDPDRGLILVDGKDLRTVKLASYREQLGIVLQEPVLFDGTVRENVVYGKRDPSNDDLRKAAQVAQLDEFVLDLSDGYETQLVGGGDLALGQRQRINVARCIAQDPKIVLLDEPTSLVDSVSKQAIVDAIERAVKNRTAIFISHDLLTLKDLDKIIVLDGGVVVEQGSHLELLERNGIYSELWRMQVRRGSQEEGHA